MPRSRLGPLAIESKLGEHPTQGNVYRAIHVQQRRAIAVRVFSVPFGGTLEARTDFANEWETLKSIQHAAVARCYGGGFEETDAYLAHELVDGESLSTQLARRQRLSWESTLDFAEPLADALVYLHGRGIIHGAIGPDKIMISGLSPVLLDVRINRSEPPFRSERPPTPMEVALTPPECISNGTRCSTLGDLYSFGATLYLMLTGSPPISGDSVDEILANIRSQIPTPAASVALDCPVWLDKLITQLLEKNPAARPPDAAAVKLALAEVRRRSMSLSGVAEHASSGFSPLNVTDQQERDEARALLGREVVHFEGDETPLATAWHDKPWVLIVSLASIVALITYSMWPLSEGTLRERAEALLQQESRSALVDAKLNHLDVMLRRFPEGQHAQWAKEQVDRVDVALFLHSLSVKKKNILPLINEGERLHTAAMRYESLGDYSAALDKYRGIVTVLGQDPQYQVAVNAARQKIAEIEQRGEGATEAIQIVQSKLDEAEKRLSEGKVVEAKRIWYGLIELYGNNSNMAPLVAKAQERLAQQSAVDRQPPKDVGETP